MLLPTHLVLILPLAPHLEGLQAIPKGNSCGQCLQPISHIPHLLLLVPSPLYNVFLPLVKYLSSPKGTSTRNTSASMHMHQGWGCCHHCHGLCWVRALVQEGAACWDVAACLLLGKRRCWRREEDGKADKLPCCCVSMCASAPV
jgi:hypothetical protein